MSVGSYHHRLSVIKKLESVSRNVLGLHSTTSGQELNRIHRHCTLIIQIYLTITGKLKGTMWILLTTSSAVEQCFSWMGPYLCLYIRVRACSWPNTGPCWLSSCSTDQQLVPGTCKVLKETELRAGKLQGRIRCIADVNSVGLKKKEKKMRIRFVLVRNTQCEPDYVLFAIKFNSAALKGRILRWEVSMA